MAFSLDLVLLIFFTAVYVFLFVFYLVKISRLKKEGEAPKAQKAFVPSVIVSALLLTLTYLIPMDTWILALMDACSVLSLVIVMRERISQLKKENS